VGVVTGPFKRGSPAAGRAAPETLATSPSELITRNVITTIASARRDHFAIMALSEEKERR
jgi:hypothetical protein